MDDRATQPGYRRLGDANVAAHRAILAAARNGDADEVRRLMIKHIDEAGRLVRGLEAAMHRRFILDSELQRRIVPRRRPSRQEKTP
jgi:DNA-binding GntR family transcriptional regulator